MNGLFKTGDLSVLGKPGEYLTKVNKDFVTKNDAFKKLLELVQDEKNLPLVNHCTAGKDRTGFWISYDFIPLF
ncbi:tyrosine-protein phosphatase [Bacillus cereus]